jgi:hypothetical protein
MTIDIEIARKIRIEADESHAMNKARLMDDLSIVQQRFAENDRRYECVLQKIRRECPHDFRLREEARHVLGDGLSAVYDHSVEIKRCAICNYTEERKL